MREGRCHGGLCDGQSQTSGLTIDPLSSVICLSADLFRHSTRPAQSTWHAQRLLHPTTSPHSPSTTLSLLTRSRENSSGWGGEEKLLGWTDICRQDGQSVGVQTVRTDTGQNAAAILDTRVLALTAMLSTALRPCLPTVYLPISTLCLTCLSTVYG